jgi:4-amino-4-deoxy-L-arabinose transferase-like glycosyltransferase
VLRDPYAVWLFYGKKIMETKTIPLYYGNAADISWSGNYPPLISFLASFYFIALGQAAPEAFNHISWLYGGLILLATFMLARELGLGRGALMSAFLITTSSLFTLELINYGYVTVAWSFYIAASCFYLVKCLQEKTWYASFAFGLSLGAALLSTYLSFIFVASLLTVLLAGVLVRKIRKRALVFEHKFLIIGLVIAFAIILPWLIRNYVLLGNPVYPWFYELFGGKGIDVALIRTVPQIKYTLYQLLTDNTLFALANEDIGYTLLFFGLIGAMYLVWRKEKASAYVGWLTVTFFMIFLGFMSLYYGYERYLLMAAPLLAVSAGHLLYKIFSSKKRMPKMLALMSIIIFSLPNYAYLISLMPYGALVGETEQLSYVGHYIDSYLSPNAIILTNELQLYFINRKAINVYNLPDAFRAKNLTELIYSLKLMNITHVLISTNIDADVLGKTTLMHALIEYNDTFEVLLNILPYTLYKVNYSEGLS